MSFESICKALDFFQEKTDTISSSGPDIVKLQVISDKLDLLKKKAHFLSSEVELPILNEFNPITTNFSEIELSRTVSEKLIELYNKIDSNFFLSYQDSENLGDGSFLRTVTISLVIDDFIIESSFEKVLIDLMYIFPENTLSYGNFLSFKESLVKSSFYDIANFEKFSSISLKKMESITESSKLFQMGSSLDTDFCLSSIANLLHCSFFGVDDISYIHYFEGSDAPFRNAISLTANDLDSMKSQNLLMSRSYLLSTVNIVNCSTLF